MSVEFIHDETGNFCTDAMWDKLDAIHDSLHKDFKIGELVIEKSTGDICIISSNGCTWRVAGGNPEVEISYFKYVQGKNDLNWYRWCETREEPKTYYVFQALNTFRKITT